MTRGSGRVLGIDYGSKRIGVAVSDPLNIIARSLGVIHNDAGVFETLRRYVTEFEIGLIVVGMPYTLGGEKGDKAHEVDDFVGRVKREVGIDVVTIDERLTSSIARKTMLMMGTTKKQRRQKSRIDEIASAVILQNYLDRRK